MGGAAAWLLWWGCTAPGTDPKGAAPEDTDPPAVDSDPGGDTDGGGIDTDGGGASPSDEAIVRGLIADGGDPLAVAHAVAWSGGWPVRTSAGTFLFLALGDDPWRLAGDHDGWEGQPMVRATGFSWLEIEIAEPEGSGYKFFGDDPVGEADPFVRAFLWDTFGRLGLVRPHPERPHLERYPALEGRGLRPRDVDVWVPPGPGPWPLAVMHDGQNLFDPGAIWGGWRLDEAMSELDGALLVVGLYNTADRMSEYTHAEDEIDGLGVVEPSGDAYADLVALDVVPWAEGRWPLDGRRLVLGSSLGGLISLHTAARHPDTFDMAASLSGTLGWGRFGRSGPTVEEEWVDVGRGSTALYVDSGGGPGADLGCFDPNGDGSFADDPDDSDNYCTNRGFADRMSAIGFEWDVDLRHWWEPGAPHSELAWAERVGGPLAWILAQD